MDDTFAIEIVEVQENEDGSAVLTIEMDNRARELLIEAGFVALLKKHLDEVESS
jgi:hypothetical protein